MLGQLAGDPRTRPVVGWLGVMFIMINLYIRSGQLSGLSLICCCGLIGLYICNMVNMSLGATDQCRRNVVFATWTGGQ